MAKTMNGVVVIILAAGKGTRMKSNKPKFLHEAAGKPLLFWTLQTLQKTGIEDKDIFIVYRTNRAKKAFPKGSYSWVLQKNALGTANAVGVALPHIPASQGTTLVFYADDSFLYSPQTLKSFLKDHVESNSPMTIMTVWQDKPLQVGALKRDKQGRPIGFWTKSDLLNIGLTKNEVVCGAFCFSKDWLEKTLRKIKPAASGEYLLTLLIEIAARQGSPARVFELKNRKEWLGVNTQEDLAVADKLKREQLKEQKV